jgi:hypothetical protein
MMVSDPLGNLQIQTKDQEQFVYQDIGFSADRFPLVKTLRRAYVNLSIGAHFIKSIGLLFSSKGN